MKTHLCACEAQINKVTRHGAACVTFGGRSEADCWGDTITQDEDDVDCTACLSWMQGLTAPVDG